jgi:hypothetical protein
MRKIQTQAEIDKKKKLNGIILGTILIGLLVLAPLAYSFSSGLFGSDNKEEFNGFEFKKNGVYWVLDLQEQQFIFRNLPQEITGVSVFGFYDLNSYFEKVLYFVNLEGSNEAGQEILNNLERYVSRSQEACLNSGVNMSDCGDLPVKSCEDNLIIFEDSLNNITSVRKEGNCVYISGDLLAGSDAFLYKLLGITS